MGGWYPLDRVIDAPGNQDVLTWEGRPGRRGPLGPYGQTSRAPYVCYVCLRCEKDVDYLPMAKPVSQITTRGSAVTVRAFQVKPVAGSPHRRP